MQNAPKIPLPYFLGFLVEDFDFIGSVVENPNYTKTLEVFDNIFENTGLGGSPKELTSISCGVAFEGTV